MRLWHRAVAALPKAHFHWHTGTGTHSRAPSLARSWTFEIALILGISLTGLFSGAVFFILLSHSTQPISVAIR
jgi:hypothetical protein